MLKEIRSIHEPLVAIINIFNKEPHVITQQKTVDLVLLTLRALFPNASIGAGTNAFFAELNRDRVLIDGLDFVVYSFNP